MKNPHAWIVTVVVGIVAGCASGPDVRPTLTHSPRRDAQLMALAAREAAQISDPDQRLTRQLNLAERQLMLFGAPDAITTLGEAKQTLLDQGDKLNTHARISGWVSISELARRANDKALAQLACDKGVEKLHQVARGAERCQYVMGLAEEVSHLRGQKEAGKLLSEAGAWAREIDPLDERRRALLAFAVALFNFDANDDAIAVLRQEPDAAWRSDTLVRLATPSVVPSAGLASADRSMSPMPQTFYGKQLNYSQVFQGQMKSNTETSK